MAQKINEDKLLAIIYTNFKGRGQQRDDWIYIAEKLNELKKIHGSDGKVASNLGLSREMVRSTLKLLDLPEEIKKLIREKKITQDLGWRLLGIKNEKIRVQVAKEIIGLNSHDARDMIRFAKNNPQTPISEQIDRLKINRKKNARLNLVILSLDEYEYEKLFKISKEKNVSVNKLVSDLIKSWLEKK